MTAMGPATWCRCARTASRSPRWCCKATRCPACSRSSMCWWRSATSRRVHPPQAGRAGARAQRSAVPPLTELSSDWYWKCDPSHRFISFGGRNLRDVGVDDWRSAFFGRAVWELPNLVRESAAGARTARCCSGASASSIFSSRCARTMARCAGPAPAASPSSTPTASSSATTASRATSPSAGWRRIDPPSGRTRHADRVADRALFLDELGRSMHTRTATTSGSRSFVTSIVSRSSTTRSATTPATCSCGEDGEVVCRRACAGRPGGAARR